MLPIHLKQATYKYKMSSLVETFYAIVLDIDSVGVERVIT